MTVNVKIDTLAIIGCDEMFLVSKMKHPYYIYTFYKVKMLKYIDNVTNVNSEQVVQRVILDRDTRKISRLEQKVKHCSSVA